MRTLRLLPILLLALLSIGGHRAYWRNDSQTIAMVPLPLDAANPERRRVGALTYLGGWELRSDNSRFGGISGMVALPDGRFLALSDAGTLIGFTPGRAGKMADSFIAALPGVSEDSDYRDFDSEGMTRDPDSGRIWISYEARHAIRRMPASLSRIDGVKRLAFAKNWRANGGVETLVRLADGRFLIISETHSRPDGSHSAYLFSGDPVETGSRVMPFGYRAPNGYRPTDAALLPDGRILILNRRIAFPDGFSAKLTLVDPAMIKEDAAVQPQRLAALAAPLLVDNMEALAVTQQDGRLIVWMLSDNNFSAMQRSLLLKFALTLPNKKPEAEPAPGFQTL